MPETKYEKLQALLKNNWWGVALIAAPIVLLSVAQFGDSADKIAGWFRSAPLSDLLVQDASVEPLASDETPREAAPDATYPWAARVKFHIRHNQRGRDQISIRRIDVRVISYDKDGTCPFDVSGNNIYGAGPAPIRVFQVRMSEGRVHDVQVKFDGDKPPSRGNQPNLLDLDPPYEWDLTDTGKESDDPMEVRFLLMDSGTYKVGLSMHYSTLTESRTKEIATVNLCRPRI
jgi:hypothetical protein